MRQMKKKYYGESTLLGMTRKNFEFRVKCHDTHKPMGSKYKVGILYPTRKLKTNSIILYFGKTKNL